ncbi:23950_t:CDS:2, partial [Dentiscutata erythropus]
MTSEQKYPGYEELTSYLTRSRDKSFWGFLHRCRDTIVTTTSATSRRQDLEATWVSNFLLETRKLGEDLEEMVSEDRKRYDFEDYWNDVINECKIRRDISERKVEKERILRDLSKINDEIKMKEDELTRILNKRKIHLKDSSNLDEYLIAQSFSAIDENSTAMQSSSAIDYANNSTGDAIRRKKIQREAGIQDVAPDPTCTTDTVAIVNNLDETETQNVDKINRCTSSESSRKIEIIANTSQDQTQKSITNFVVDSKVPHDIKTVNQVNDQYKSAVDQNIVTEFVQ